MGAPLATVNVGEWIAAVAAIASAFAAVAAWAAVRVAARAAEEDRRDRRLIALGTLHEELLAARDVVNARDVDADALEDAYRRVSRAEAAYGAPHHAVWTALATLGSARQNPQDRGLAALNLADAAAGVEEALTALRTEPRPPRWWQIRRRWRERPRRVKLQPDSG